MATSLFRGGEKSLSSVLGFAGVYFGFDSIPLCRLEIFLQAKTGEAVGKGNTCPKN
jgi:hypothetical protein